MDVIAQRNRLAAQRVIQALKSRRMDGYYAENRAEALKIALSLIPEGSSVGWGGSTSITEIGLKDAIRQGNYRAVDREAAPTPEEFRRIEKQCFLADFYLMSTNAITEDGQLVNLDGKGNRVAALCYGPDQVLVIAGMNKLVRTLDDAISRTRNTAAPINAQRFTGDTPCRQLGTCGDCRKPDCICNQLVITRGSMIPGRVKVILVGESLGF